MKLMKFFKKKEILTREDFQNFLKVSSSYIELETFDTFMEEGIPLTYAIVANEKLIVATNEDYGGFEWELKTIRKYKEIKCDFIHALYEITFKDKIFFLVINCAGEKELHGSFASVQKKYK